MRDTVLHRDFLEVEGAYALQAGNVDPVLIGIRAPLVMGVDAAFRAKVMLRRHGVELIERQKVRALADFKIAKFRRHGYRSAHAAI